MPHDVLLGNQLRNALADLFFLGEVLIDRANRMQKRLDRLVGLPLTEERAELAVLAPVVPRVAEQLMPDEQCGPQCPAGVPGRGLDPDVLEGSFTQNLAVGDAVERHAARQSQVLRTGERVRGASRTHHDLFGHDLDRRCDVHLALGDVGFRRARWAFEEFVHPWRGHDVVVAVGEIGHIHLEGSVFLQVQQVVEDPVAIDRFAIRRESHQLVLAAIHLETGEVGHGRVEQPDRMREAHFLEHLNLVCAAVRDTACCPFANAVHRENGRIVKWRREEGARRMGLMMLRKHEAPRVPALETRIEFTRRVEFFLEPERQTHHEELEAEGRTGDVGLENPIELQQGLVVERDEVQVLVL